MDKQTEQSLRAVDSSIKDIAGRITAQNFLLQQLYAQWFLSDNGARKAVPKEFIGAMQFNATDPRNSPAALDIQTEAVRYLERFFADVEGRVAQTAWAQQRQQETK
jgi:hypothetical protein